MVAMIGLIATMLLLPKEEVPADPFPEKVPPIEAPATPEAKQPNLIVPEDPADATVGASHKLIVVSIAEQRLRAYEWGTLVMDLRCSTGRPGMDTPRGDWPIHEKRRYNRALPKYGGGPIPFSLRLDIRTASGARPRIAIHSYPSVPSYPASHGCIRVRPSDAPKLFAWAQEGMIVRVE